MSLDLVAAGTVAAVVAAATLRAATPILFSSLGGLISELAGCINVALEGVMLVAAFAGVITSAYSALWFPDAPCGCTRGWGVQPACWPARRWQACWPCSIWSWGPT
ncbi:hypothetical protein UCD39_15555 [Nitrospirillum sp. BR 11752]|uniref:hypothetical protein n=1 Tax=Nitrospirillum sp. BR 11752 TaxID=3104293 RepID=UPI002EACE4EA|nr:hypothetical protein [Nitrospirillum sp. BR 11752]